MKKIVHIIIGLNIGGAELMLERLILTSTKKKHYEHIVISLTDLGIIGPKLITQGIKVYSLDIKSLISLPRAFFRLKKILRDLEPDVVQTWMYHADFLGGLTAKTIGIENIIWGIRNTDIRRDHHLIKRFFFKACSSLSYVIPTHIVCVAKKAKVFHMHFGYDSNKMIVIPNGFDLTKFSANRDYRDNLRAQLNLNEKDLVIGNIGRFDRAKNHINFIKACLLLLNKGYNFKVLLAGREVNLDNPEILKILERSKFINNFIFMGEINNTPEFYNAIDIFCLCSITEGFPNVLGEAMASEKVCFSTDAGDAWDILAESGFKIRSPSSRDIAIAIEENIFKNSAMDLKKTGHKARLSIMNNFSIEKVVSQFESLY